MLIGLLSAGLQAEEPALSARDILQQANQAVASPFLYEEQVIVLTDGKQHRNVRQTRLYQRIDQHLQRFLMVFDSPSEIQGVAIRVLKQAEQVDTDLYLPALTGRLIPTGEGTSQAGLLGTDLILSDLIAVDFDLYEYELLKDLHLDEQQHYQIKATPISRSGNEQPLNTRYYLVRKDIGRVTRTEEHDPQGRVLRRRSEHQFVNYADHLWLPSMILIEDYKKNHQTLIKIKRRVLSADYVPAEVFSNQWLLTDQHKASTAQHLFNRISSSIIGQQRDAYVSQP